MGGGERRSCVLCGRVHDKASYSEYQWGEGRLAKCNHCVRGQSQPERPTLSAAERAASFASAAAVSSGRAVEPSGLRSGAAGEVSAPRATSCIARWYRDAPLSFEHEGQYNALGEKSLLLTDLRVAQAASSIIEEWNAARLVDGVMIQLAVPQVMQVASGLRKGAHVLVERSVGREPLTKFNSNSGWSLRRHAPLERGASDEMRLAHVLDALSHFSYHASGGEVYSSSGGRGDSH